MKTSQNVVEAIGSMIPKFKPEQYVLEGRMDFNSIQKRTSSPRVMSYMEYICVISRLILSRNRDKFYLILHENASGMPSRTYFFYDDESNGWYRYNEPIKNNCSFLWNPGIVFLYFTSPN